MIQLAVSIVNPWSQRWRMMRCWWGRLGRHTAWELAFYATNDIFRAELRWLARCDHAGLTVELGLLGFALEFGIHDSRHWDRKRKTWIN